MIDRYDYFLFDWDGTLANTLEIWADAWQNTFKEFGIELTHEQVVTGAFGNWYAPEEMGIEDTASFKSELYFKVVESMKTAKLHDGVEEVLRELKAQGKKLAIVTSSKRSVVQPALDFNGIQDLPDVFYGEEDTTMFKPDPEILLKAMNDFQASSEKTVMIGDSDKDVGAGKNAGVTTVVFYPTINQTFYPAERIQSWQPDMIIEHFNKLLESK